MRDTLFKQVNNDIFNLTTGSAKAVIWEIFFPKKEIALTAETNKLNQIKNKKIPKPVTFFLIQSLT